MEANHGFNLTANSVVVFQMRYLGEAWQLLKAKCSAMFAAGYPCRYLEPIECRLYLF